MILGTYIGGQVLTYDEATGGFLLGIGPISVDELHELADAGEIAWAQPDFADWFESWFPAAPVAAMPAPVAFEIPQEKPRTTLVVAGVVSAVLLLSLCVWIGILVFGPPPDSSPPQTTTQEVAAGQDATSAGETSATTAAKAAEEARAAEAAYAAAAAKAVEDAKAVQAVPATATAVAPQDASNSAAANAAAQANAAAAAKAADEAQAAEARRAAAAKAAAAARRVAAAKAAAAAAAAAKTKKSDPIVYVTATDRWYHRAGCTHLSQGFRPMRLSQAKAAGYKPCPTCKPPG